MGLLPSVHPLSGLDYGPIRTSLSPQAFREALQMSITLFYRQKTWGSCTARVHKEQVAVLRGDLSSSLGSPAVPLHSPLQGRFS